MKKLLTEAQLKKLLTVWQERLMLRDWRIELKVVPRGSMPDGRLAQCTTTPTRQLAKIDILRADHTPDTETDRDMEEDLVHELTHVHFPHLSGDEAGNNYVLFERGIEVISVCFVRAYRKGKKK